MNIMFKHRNFNNFYTNSKSEILNFHPVRYKPNLFFLNIYNLVKMIWNILPVKIDFILRGRQTQIPKFSLDARKIYLGDFSAKCFKHCFRLVPRLGIEGEFWSFGLRNYLCRTSSVRHEAGFRVSKLGFSRAIAGFIFIPILLMATKYAGEFQELGVGGRACGMGGTGVANFSDPSVIYFNPAGSFFSNRGILLMHAENFAGIVKNDFGSIILPKENLSVGVGLQYVSVGDIKLTTLPDTSSPPSGDNPPVPYDTVGTKDFVFYINGSKGNDKLSYGANIKVFYRDLVVMTGFGGGIDLGIALNMENFKVGFAIRDFILSPLMWSNGSKETILPKFAFGISPVMSLDRIHSVITLECNFIKSFDIDGFNMNLGLEYAYKNFIFGRIGIYTGNYTLGVGLLYKSFRLDYALVTHSELENSNKFSAGLQF